MEYTTRIKSEKQVLNILNLENRALSGDGILDLWIDTYGKQTNSLLDVNATIWSLHSQGKVKFTNDWLVETVSYD